jgi:putative ABC transport system permease protein
MVQVLLLLFFGLAIGLALALLTGFFLAGKVPFAVNVSFFLGIIVLFVVCTILGGLASVRSVAKIDPVEAIG